MSEFGVKPVFEVRLSKNGEALCTFFRAAFEKKYGCQPLLELEDTEVMRWLARSFPDDIEKCQDIIATYFEMSDKEFVENGHTPFWLKKKINKVLATLGRLNAVLKGSKTIRIDSETHCANPYCIPGLFRIRCAPHELGELQLCARCALEKGVESLEYKPKTIDPVAES